MRIAGALLIWTAVSLVLGGLIALAGMKIKARRRFLAERGSEFEVIGDFTLRREDLGERDNGSR